MYNNIAYFLSRYTNLKGSPIAFYSLVFVYNYVLSTTIALFVKETVYILLRVLFSIIFSTCRFVCLVINTLT